jgi:hypothetical protein
MNLHFSDYINTATGYTLFASKSTLLSVVLLQVPSPSQGAIDELLKLAATFLITVFTKIIFKKIDKKISEKKAAAAEKIEPVKEVEAAQNNETE